MTMGQPVVSKTRADFGAPFDTVEATRIPDGETPQGTPRFVQDGVQTQTRSPRPVRLSKAQRAAAKARAKMLDTWCPSR